MQSRNGKLIGHPKKNNADSLQSHTGFTQFTQFTGLQYLYDKNHIQTTVIFLKAARKCWVKWG